MLSSHTRTRCYKGQIMHQYSDDIMPFLLLRILVTDHIVSINERLTTMLSDMEGICVFGCTQESDKILTLVETVHPDVVILDLFMDHSNLDLLRKIKHLESAPVVIMLSLYDIPPLREASLSAGADYFLVKTTGFAFLPDLVQQLRQEKIQIHDLSPN